MLADMVAAGCDRKHIPSVTAVLSEQVPGAYTPHWRTVPDSGRTADSIGTGCRMADGASHPTSVDRAGATQPVEPGGMKQLPNWVTGKIRLVTGTIELDKEPPRHDLLNAWIAVASAVVVGAVLGLQSLLVISSWMRSRRSCSRPCSSAPN